MIIIFNLMGAVVTISGLLAGAVLLVLTGKVTIAILAIVSIWMYFGRSKADKETGEKQPAPSVFFIPMFFWGIVGCLALFPAVMIDIAMALNDGKPVVRNPLTVQFEADEEGLASNESDDQELSKELRSMMSEVFPDIYVNIRVKSSPTAVLILMKAPDLKKVPEKTRKLLLEAIQKVAREVRPDVLVYVGIRGRLAYGAVLTPDAPMSVGSIVDDHPLYGFYRTFPSEGEPDKVEMTPTNTAEPEPADAETPSVPESRSGADVNDKASR